MGRPFSPLTAAEVAPALAYLRRALEREAQVFSKPLRLVSAAYATLLTTQEHAKPADALDMVNAWLDAYLTREGRAAMRTAMRRRRADVSNGPRRTKTIRLPDHTYQNLDRLAGTIGLPLLTTLDHLLYIALVDGEMREMMLKLALAVSVSR